MVELQGGERRRYVADLFTRISSHYDLMNDLMTLGMHRRWKRRTARQAAHGFTGPALDVACGTGDLALELARCSGVDRVVGIDLLPVMAARAQEKSAGRERFADVSMLVGDALSLPFSDATFCCATAGFSLRNMPDIPQSLREMVRVVRPGGRVALLELTPMQGGLKSILFRPYFHGLVPLIGKVVAGDRSAYTYLPQSVDRFLEAESLAAMLRGLGLSPVSYRRLGAGTVCLHWGEKPIG